MLGNVRRAAPSREKASAHTKALLSMQSSSPLSGSALLGKPDGLESLTPLAVVLEMGAQPISVARHDRYRKLALDPAASPDRAGRPQSRTWSPRSRTSG